MSSPSRISTRVVAWDHRWGPLARSVWLFIITLLLLITIAKMQGVVSANRRAIKTNGGTLRAVQSGRRVSIGVTCAALSAVANAGREAIVSRSVMPESPLARFLEQHGYPPPAVRVRQARAAAAAYGRAIAVSVDRQLGHSGDSLVRADGTLNCGELQRLSAVSMAMRRWRAGASF